MHNRQRLIIAIGILFTFYGAILYIMSNLDIGVMLVLLLGVAVTALGIFYDKITKLTKSGFFRICKILIIIIFGAELILVSFIALYGANDNVNYNEDAVIVLGAGIRGDKVTFPLKMRLDKALEYHSKNPEAVIVVTGGQGFQETVTEAYAMKKYLIEKGIPKDKIIKEEKATSTLENMEYSKIILDKLFKKDYSVVVITNNFHVFRGASLAGHAGFKDVSHMHSGLQWYNLMPCYLRESLAVLKMLIIGA